jgi:hypothetical protein
MLGCGLCLNEEGQLLLKWKQTSLDDHDNGMSNWHASDATPCFWNGVACTHGSVSVLDFSAFLKEGEIDLRRGRQFKACIRGGFG